MKNYAKVGGKKGKPGYSTPSQFIAKKALSVNKTKQIRKTTGNSRGKKTSTANLPRQISC